MWGQNSCDEILSGNTPQQCTPLLITAYGNNVTQMALGSELTATLTSGNDMYVISCNTRGEAGDGTDSPCASPYLVSITGKVIQTIEAGGLHTGALTTDGSLYLWGRNSNGQLGDGTTTDRYYPTQVNWLYGTIAGLSLGGVHSAAWTTGGTLYTWGGDGFCQLGYLSLGISLVPVSVLVAGNAVVSASAGGENTGTITTGGQLYVWGDNSAGQLGDGTYTTECLPETISVAAKTVVAFAFGDYQHACAKTADNDLYCWGANSYGQLGIGTFTSTPRPTLVLPNVDTFALGYGTTGAVLQNGSLWMWGLNSQCDVGDGTTTNRSAPVQIFAGGAVQIFAGYWHSAALVFQ